MVIEEEIEEEEVEEEVEEVVEEELVEEAHHEALEFSLFPTELKESLSPKAPKILSSLKI